MRLPLTRSEDRDGFTVLRVALTPSVQPVTLEYRTRTGALLRVDGNVCGAFDREHTSVDIPASANTRELTLEVETRSLPTNGLPSGGGLQWWLLNALSHPAPALRLQARLSAPPAQGDREAQAIMICHPEQVLSGGQNRSRRAPSKGVPLIGHSHLDVAWLWTYEQAQRKALRTFAIALDLLDRDPSFIFSQSQPQLYRFVQDADPEFFARLLTHVRPRRFDPTIAAMWVEPDCNLPSGESLLRQLLFGYEYCRDTFGTTPRVAWLPDSFGFANTLPMLLRNAGIEYFATTKLEWNDTTEFPYRQFRWKAPDGSEVTAALIKSYDGGIDSRRIAAAVEREEPLIAGYGDGGGGVTPAMLEAGRDAGYWSHVDEWFDTVAHRSGDLPVHSDELYLEYHRGVYTTHHDLKSGNALLERALIEAEELVCWCVAVRAPAMLLADFRSRLNAAWEIVLRNQFHDVLPGTSIAEVSRDARSEYDGAGEIVASVLTGAAAALPRTRSRTQTVEPVEPQIDDRGNFVFENAHVRVVVKPSGAIVELAAESGPNVATNANLLALYKDRPAKWEAWNIDDGYQRSLRGGLPGSPTVRDGRLEIPFRIGRSTAGMQIELLMNEPFVRVELAVNWRERRKLLRLESWLPLQAEHVTYGTPHGTIDRSSRAQTAQERAKFEVPGQRFALARNQNGAGLAILARDTYGWSGRSLPKGGLHLGHSLLRATTWPDPNADIDEQRFAYAFMPFVQTRISDIERAWIAFAHEPRVRLFSSETVGVLVVACKPAQDGDGVILRLRECDGIGGQIRIRCAGRMREVTTVDALERPIGAPADIEAESLQTSIPALGLRSLRVRF
ncbi:MAG: hypothetical protein M3Y21_04665 [Candidatus Eremiobacteraeota bacterium]|nr:hypothetical protein [Candidatus Eremiobacteraeota bacterium]